MRHLNYQFVLIQQVYTGSTRSVVVLTAYLPRVKIKAKALIRDHYTVYVGWILEDRVETGLNDVFRLAHQPNFSWKLKCGEPSGARSFKGQPTMRLFLSFYNLCLCYLRITAVLCYLIPIWVAK